MRAPSCGSEADLGAQAGKRIAVMVSVVVRAGLNGIYPHVAPRNWRVRFLLPAPIPTRFRELATPNSLLPLCRICAVVFYRDGTHCTKAFRVGREVIGCKVRVTPHHRGTLPATQLLQREQRRAVLHVPRSPAVEPMLCCA
jgi:hypothetical protein